MNSDGLKLNALGTSEHLLRRCRSAGFLNKFYAELTAGETVTLMFSFRCAASRRRCERGMDLFWKALIIFLHHDALAEGLLQAGPASTDICGACFFDSEEIGSETRDGAAGKLL